MTTSNQRDNKFLQHAHTTTPRDLESRGVVMFSKCQQYYFISILLFSQTSSSRRTIIIGSFGSSRGFGFFFFGLAPTLGAL